MSSARVCFQNFLDCKPLSRPSFIPFIGSLLSRIEDEPMEVLTADPGLWANSLVKAVRLFGFDGIVTGVDPRIAAASCGSRIQWENDCPIIHPVQGPVNPAPQQSPEMALSLEVSKRAFSVCRQQMGCITALTGPYTLAAQLYGSREPEQHISKIKPLMVEITRAYCDTQPDALIFMEADALPCDRIEPGHRRIFNTLKNIAAYYNIPAGLYIENYPADNMAGLAKLGMDFYIFGPSENKDLVLTSELWGLCEDAIGLGIGLPLKDIRTSKAMIDKSLELQRDNPGLGLFYTSLGVLGKETDLDGLHAIRDVISR